MEILAPAGSFSALKAAVINGADAVYLGASAFSARAKAANFSEEELASAVRYCHLFNVKVYLAVNTVIKLSEYKEALSTIKYADSVGVDAFILQDLPFIAYLHSTMPDITIHLSTQAGVHNLEGALAAEKLGVSRVILSRETLIEDVRKITAHTKLETEFFVHGALCVAFSGNCYFSSMIAGLSGNRGRCLQFCRKKYEINGKKGYWLSAKDLDLSDKINELRDAGVCSLKIEGRMRRPEYVGEAVRHYKALVGGKQDSGENLKKLFNRGNSCTAYLNNQTENVIYPYTQGHMGVEIGKVTEVCGKKAILNLRSPLKRGDGLKFLRNKTEVGSSLVSSNGNCVGYEGNLRKGDIVNLTTDVKLMDEINARSRFVSIDVKVFATVGNPLKVELSCGGYKLSFSSDFEAARAEKSPLTEKDFKECFLKTGNTYFLLKNFECDTDDEVFVLKSMLNEFRRKVYSDFENFLISEYNKRRDGDKLEKFTFDKDYLNSNDNDLRLINGSVMVQVDNLSLLEDCLDLYDYAAYFPKVYDGKVAFDIEKFESETGKLVFLTLPNVLRGGDVENIKKILASSAVKNVIVNNIGGLELAKGKNTIWGPMMNLVNPDFRVLKILSPEYDENKFGDNFVYIYGYLPLMTFSHCPKKSINNGKCVSCKGEDLSIKDETGKVFLLRNYRIKYCYSQLLNCNVLDNISECKKRGVKNKFVDLIGVGGDAKEILMSLKNGKSNSLNSTHGYFNKKLL